jgi:predicted nucleic acid-binding protein
VTFVLDNSVALAWCFQDEQTPDLLALLDRVAETGAIAPLLWPLEALNGLLMAERRRRLTSQQRATLAALLHDLPITLDDETATRAWTETATLAERFALSLYDAAYLELAHRRRLPLATLDRPLRTAAATLGLPLLPPNP